MSKYIIPGKYGKYDADFLCTKLSDSAKNIFGEAVGVRIYAIPIEVENNTIMEQREYIVAINSNDCVSNEILRDWATEEIVVGYCRAVARL